MNEKFIIKTAEYKTSAVDRNGLLSDLNEIAFVGRSNVGKSSFINCLVNQKALARTSSTAGLTKMVNYFLINKDFYFVDLPGYGYSKTGKKHQDLWSTLIEDYLKLSKNLKLVIMLVDIRHTPSEEDIMMQKFLFYNNIPYKVVANKADKIPKSQVNKYLSEIAKTLCLTVNNLIPFSSVTRLNKDKILDIIGENK